MRIVSYRVDYFNSDGDPVYMDFGSFFDAVDFFESTCCADLYRYASNGDYTLLHWK